MLMREAARRLTLPDFATEPDEVGAGVDDAPDTSIAA
jgi:hypothetical protein